MATAMATATAWDWLKTPYLRRSSLRDVETAVRRQQLAGPELAGRRQALVDVLYGLLNDPTLRPREMVRIGRILAVMGGQNLDRATTAG